MLLYEVKKFLRHDYVHGFSPERGRLSHEVHDNYASGKVEVRKCRFEVKSAGLGKGTGYLNYWDPSLQNGCEFIQNPPYNFYH